MLLPVDLVMLDIGERMLLMMEEDVDAYAAFRHKKKRTQTQYLFRMVAELCDDPAIEALLQNLLAAQ